jgi:hypothetical protein
VPAASTTERVTVPLVVPTKFRAPVVVAAMPIVGVAVKAGPDPAKTLPAAPVTVMFPVAVVIARGEEAVTTGVPLEVPHVTVGVPAAACGVIVTAPEELPSRISWPIVVLARPSVSAPALILASILPLTTLVDPP